MQKWTDPENEYLKQHWQTQSRSQMARVLGRTLDSVRPQCRKLGLTFAATLPKVRGPSRLELKSQRIAQEEAAIIEHLQTHGHARKSELYQRFKFTNLAKRLKLMKAAGLIKHEQRGLCQAWSLGQQVGEKKQFIRVITKPEPLNLHALPEHIRRWFGLIDFTPPIGRIIAEKMPNIPPRSQRNTLGCGSSAYLDLMPNL